MLRREVYLDNNATTYVVPRVRRRIHAVLEQHFGNPSSPYRVGRASNLILEESRKQIARTLNAGRHEIIFTGSASEGNNAILKSLADIFFPRKKTIISTPIEHASIMSTLRYLGGRGIRVVYCPVNRCGRVDTDRLEALVDPDTFLVCCALANNETGVLQDVDRIAGIAKAKGALVMSDCVQALGKIPVDVRQLGVDYAVFSAHKIHGPKGAGCIFVKEGSPFAPFIHGGHQEYGLRAGTEGLHNIAGFAEACSLVPESAAAGPALERLKERFLAGLRAIKPDIVVNSPPDACLPNTLSVTFPGISNAVFTAALDYHGVSVSGGSACNTQSNEPSHVLKALGRSDLEARETVRFSFSRETGWGDLRYTLGVIRKFIGSGNHAVEMVHPARMDERMLFGGDARIIDLRFWFDRKFFGGLPVSHQAVFFLINKQLKRLAKDSRIVVVCQTGGHAPAVAYYLRTRGFTHTGFLLGGLAAWRLAQPQLYERYADRNLSGLAAAAAI